MYKEIYNKIKKYDNIVIARHISVDPDAMASQVGLRDSIKLTFPKKNVYAIGNGTVRFNFMGKLDKDLDYSSLDNCLFIVVDTPDQKRVDKEGFSKYDYSIKIDHHPFIEKFCDLEFIDDKKSSAAEIVYKLIKNTKLKMNQKIAETLYAGMVSDTNRFMFNNKDPETFLSAYNLITEYDIDITKVYQKLYKRPLSEEKLRGYMSTNMKVTEAGVGYVKITNEVLTKFGLDSASSGNLINEYNNIDELLVWMSATEDVKNGYIKISIRSKGPTINKVAEKYNGGGHALASGAKVSSFEDVDLLIEDLNKVCLKYIESSDEDENY
jgi:Exopolyphosphatase-related proteins